MFSAAWKMLKETVLAFINDEALSRGAAIAFYTVTSIAPVLSPHLAGAPIAPRVLDLRGVKHHRNGSIQSDGRACRACSY
jgi:hypothetical protein